MADLIVPTRKELEIRRKFHADQKTMSFTDQIEQFDVEALDSFYEKVCRSDVKQFCYRLVFCDGCMDYVSETQWEYDPLLQRYLWNAIVRYDLRREGYGHETLRLMKEEAKKNDIFVFHARIKKDNEIARSFLKQEGFTLFEEDETHEVYQLKLV